MRRAHLLKPPGAHHCDPVADGEGVPLVVGDEDGRHAFLLEDAADLVAHLAAQRRVQVAERLIEQENRGAGRQGPGQGQALLLAAAQLVRIAIGQAGETHQLQHFLHPPAGVPHPPQPEGRVARHGQVGKQGVVLEDHAHLAPLRRDPGPTAGHQAAAHDDAALIRRLKARDEPQGGRLAAAAGTEES